MKKKGFTFVTTSKQIGHKWGKGTKKFFHEMFEKMGKKK